MTAINDPVTGLIPGATPQNPLGNLSLKRQMDSRLADVDPLGEDHMVINFGPQHPATHGTLRLVIEMSGERIEKVTPEIGFLHTGMEKLGEHHTYNQFVTVTDRMNYMSALNNNVGWHVACEELFEIDVPERARVIRVIMAELSRLADHIVCLGLQAMDMGAFSVFLWAFQERERLYDIFEVTTGARLTTSYTRVGGVFRDVPYDFEKMVRDTIERTPKVLEEIDYMLGRNRIYQDRLEGIGVITREDAIHYGISGPVARSAGLERDVRRDRPYLGYDKYDFDIPILTEGDSFARYRIRLLEARESIKILSQAIEELRPGPILSNDPRVAIPDKTDVWTDMESLIHHFMDFMDNRGLKPERGEVYSATEAPNGELGFYIVSTGDGARPYRLHTRSPSLNNYTIMPKLAKGHLLSDIVAILSSINVIAGELDR